MSKKGSRTMYFPMPKTPKDKLLHVIGIMINATKSRLSYFEYQHLLNEKYLKDKVDKETGQPISKNRIYETIHVDYIFSAIQAIETLYGSLDATYTLMTASNTDLDKVTAGLINPGGRIHTVHEIVSREPLEDIDIRHIAAIPNVDSFDSTDQAFLERILAPTFDRIRNLCHYASAFWDIFKPVRNVFAHNFRFVFFDEVKTEIRPMIAETIVGFLEPDNIEINNILLIGSLQRMVFRELVLAMSNFELNVLVGLKDLVLNNLNPVLPRRIADINEKDSEKYKAFWNSQRYDFPDSRMTGIGVGDIGIQKGLYHDFMKYVTETIGREIIAVGLDGAERAARFEEPPQELRDKLKEKQAELRRRRKPREKRSRR